MNKNISIAIATFAVAIGTIIPVSSASAHDEVVSTTPSAGSTVEAGTIDVSIVFSEDVMVTPDEAGIEIKLTGPDGKAVDNGCLTVAGAEVHDSIELDQAGEYKVDWRSVSNDGHPSSGTFNFTLTNDSGYVNQGSACAEEISEVGSPMPLMAVDDKAAGANNGNSNLMGLVLGIVLIVLGSVAGALRFRARERKAAANPEILSDDK